MNKLKITTIQQFMGKEIPVVLGGFGEDKKCISDKTVAGIHEMKLFHVRELINNNIKRFKVNVDFIDLKQRIDEDDTLELLYCLGYAKQSITQADHIYILSERGYAKIIKIMDTDLAWEIHDKLMDEYFQMKEEKKYKEIKKTMTEEKQAELEIKKMRAEAMQINAKTRAFKELKETLPKEKLSNVAMEVFGIKFLEDITGKNMGSQLPQVEVTYSATEIGNKFGVSPNKIGRIAKEYNLKTEEYGITVMDKVRHSSKEIPNFRYNEKAVKRFKEILNQRV